MKRRDFLYSSGIIGAGTLVSGGILSAFTLRPEHRILGQHKIDRIEFAMVNFHWPRQVGKNARIGVHGQYKKAEIVKLYTDQGAMGWGMSRKGKIPEQELKDTLLGKRVDQVFDPAAGIADRIDRAFDHALHDLAGVILEKPVYEMLGAQGPLISKVYSGMIYFDELEPEDNPAGVEKVLENCRWDYDYGYRQLKVKIGRSGRWYTHDEGLAMDIRVVKMIHEEFGDQVEILVDANDMYSQQDTMDFLQGVEGIPIYWIEEPFVENLEESRKLKDWMMTNGREDTYYADGERQPDLETCRQLASEGKLDVFLPDMVGFGFTPWRRLMPELKKMNALSSPHAWGSLMKTHYAAHIAAGLGNVCTLEGVTCYSDEIDFGDYTISEGKLRVSNSPGFGMQLI
jgi:L-alanine-DL-glutamate epimerase-like enolase superfamily enzyme